MYELAGVFVAGLCAGAYLFRGFQRLKQRISAENRSIKDIPQYKRRWLSHGEQAQALSRARVDTKPIMSAREFQLFWRAVDWTNGKSLGLRIFPQVAMGELLQCPREEDSDAFRSFNAKRTDLVITDRAGRALIAIEYQGQAHFQGNAVERDQIKRLAFERAGVQWVQIFSDETQDDALSKLDAAWAALESGAKGEMLKPADTKLGLVPASE